MMPYSMLPQQQQQQTQPKSMYDDEASAVVDAMQPMPMPMSTMGPSTTWAPTSATIYQASPNHHQQQYYQPNSNSNTNTNTSIPTTNLQSHYLSSNFGGNFNNSGSNFNATNFNLGQLGLLSPHRHEALANYQSGVLSPSTPPVSRQRRHSKMHLRIASVDQQAESGHYSSFLGDGPAVQPAPCAAVVQPTSFGSPGKNITTTTSNSSSGVKSATSASSSSASGTNNAAVVIPAASTSKPTKERYRIVILGSSAVGKTAIVEQFLYGSFPETHCCTVEELHKGEYEIAGGQVVPLEILDTSGSFTFTAMRNLAIANGDAFALVYSIDSPESWEEVKTIRELILQLKGSDPSPPPIVVVGNKADLPEERRQVKLEVAECECIDWESGFVECSAKNNKNIINIFSCMLIQARLKGSLNVDSIIASNSARHIGYRDPASRAQRRRSSLPISELFHRSSRSDRSDRGGGGGGGLEGINRIADPRTSGTFRKRNSCTPS